MEDNELQELLDNASQLQRYARDMPDGEEKTETLHEVEQCRQILRKYGKDLPDDESNENDEPEGGNTEGDDDVDGGLTEEELQEIIDSLGNASDDGDNTEGDDGDGLTPDELQEILAWLEGTSPSDDEPEDTADEPEDTTPQTTQKYERHEPVVVYGSMHAYSQDPLVLKTVRDGITDKLEPLIGEQLPPHVAQKIKNACCAMLGLPDDQGLVRYSDASDRYEVMEELLDALADLPEMGLLRTYSHIESHRTVTMTVPSDVQVNQESAVRYAEISRYAEQHGLTFNKAAIEYGKELAAQGRK